MQKSKLPITYCCKDCGGEIGIDSAFRGQGRCNPCAKKGSRNPMFNKKWSEEHKRKLGLVHKGEKHPHFGKTLEEIHGGNCECSFCRAKKGGKNHPMYNKKLSIETRKKMSEAQTGKTISEDHRKKISEGHKGRKKSEEHKKKISLSLRGRSLVDVGHTPHCPCSFCKSKRGELRGKDAINYIDGRIVLVERIRSSQEYKNWRTSIFKRDNYTCQDCEQVGLKLQVHHEKYFSTIVSEFLKEYSQFSPIEDKETLVRLSLSWKDFWNLDNGKTLCEDCHKNYTTRISIKQEQINAIREPKSHNSASQKRNHRRTSSERKKLEE